MSIASKRSQLKRDMHAAGFILADVADPSLDLLYEKINAQVPEIVVSVKSDTGVSFKKPESHSFGVLALTQDYLLFARRVPKGFLSDMFGKASPDEFFAIQREEFSVKVRKARNSSSLESLSDSDITMPFGSLAQEEKLERLGVKEYGKVRYSSQLITDYSTPSGLKQLVEYMNTGKTPNVRKHGGPSL